MMKELFAKTTTTSIIATLIIVVGFSFLYCIAFIPAHISDSLKTQLVQGDWGIMMLAAAYYFSASKQRGVTQNADTITNQPAVGDDTKTSQS